MSDPLTLSSVLVPIGKDLLKNIATRGLKGLINASPVEKAIRSTSDRFGSRTIGLREALVVWVQSEAFKSEIEDVAGGRPSRTEAEHVDLFVRESGLQLGTVEFNTARDVLAFFYSEIYLALCESSEGARVIGGGVASLHQKLDLVLNRLPQSIVPAIEAQPLAYSPRPEVASTPRGLTPADSAAEIHLNLIRQLVDRRQSRTGLRLLADLQSKVDEGVVSVPVRFRFFLNKGVCYLISGDLDLAHQEFERARVLEPNNKKVLINLAQVENLRGNCEFALQLLQRALAIDPKDPNATSLRLACLHQLHRDAELDAEVASDPSLLDEPSCLYALASIAFDRGRFEQAENYARRHNEKDNQYPEAWELLGRTIIVPAQRVLQDQAAAPSLIPPVVVNASKRPRHASAAPSS